jgi:hypothetical protein
VCCSNLLIVDGDSCCIGYFDTLGYNSASQTCCNGAVTSSPNQACCGQTGYDNTTNICCSENFVVAGNACCQNIATGIVNGYNSSVHTCCNGYVDKSGAYSACCAGFGYNAAIAVCCQSDYQIYPGDSCCVVSNGTTQGYNKTSSTCCNGAVVLGTAGVCCGRSLFTPSTQVCCLNNPQIGDACCGTVGYYLSNATCCDKTLNVGPGLSCCGSVSFNKTRMVCCPSGVTYGDYCCPLYAGGYQGFYSSQQSCCNGLVVPGGYSVNPHCYNMNNLGQTISAATTYTGIAQIQNAFNINLDSILSEVIDTDPSSRTVDQNILMNAFLDDLTKNVSFCRIQHNLSRLKN